MALRLRQAVPGKPTASSAQKVGAVVVDQRGYIAYPSGPNVVLLTPELELAETLPFWSALPHRATTSTPANVEGICCNSEEKLVIAWSGEHVVLWWHTSSNSRGSWAVHSTVVASSAVTCLDYQTGILALGTATGIEYWHTEPGADVVVWDRQWQRILCPIDHCCAEQKQRSAYILAVGRNRQPIGMAQELRHPREIAWIGWRTSKSTSGDAHLFTITSNSVFRIYAPVLDDPSWFQLLSSLDHKAFAGPAAKGLASTKGKERENNPFGVMWAPDATVVHEALLAELNKIRELKSPDNEAIKVIESLLAEEGDIILWAGPGGSVVLRSIVNIDRKPPTLLKTLPISRSQLPPSLDSSYWCPEAILLHIPDNPLGLISVLPPSASRPSIIAPLISLAPLLTSRRNSIITTTTPAATEKTVIVQLESNVEHFVRTPNGRGLLAISETGEIGSWFKQQAGLKPEKWAGAIKPLVGKGHWQAPRPPSQAAIFAKGRAIVFYTKADDGEAHITLQHLDADASTPRAPVTLPHFKPNRDDDVEMLLAVSDIDDGHSGEGRRTQRAIIMAATRSGEAWVWRVISKITPAETIRADDEPDIELLSHYRLPLDAQHAEEGSLIVRPVDPMGWHQSVIDWTTDTPLQDMLLTVSADGDLEFWIPKIGQHLASEISDGHHMPLHDAACEINGSGDSKVGSKPWTQTGVVKTGRRNVINARCSSRKKTVLVCVLPDGRHEMTVWDSNVSEFSTGLELAHTFDAGEVIQDLDWTTTSDLQSVLAVGFAHKVVLVCEQRMSYVEATPGWAPFITIDMERYTPVPISDSIWLAGGSLAVGAGNQIYLFSRFLDRDTPASSPAASTKSLILESDEPEDIFQLIAHRNGPLLDYHPVVLAQCLMWNKGDLVKNILLQLLRSLRKSEDDGKKRLVFPRLDPSEFYSARNKAKDTKSSAKKYEGLFDSNTTTTDDDEDEFNDRAVADLVDRLHGNVALPLSLPEKTFLATVAQATLEAENQRRSLDLCGLRYLISVRMYINWDRLSGTSGTVTPASGSPVPSTRARHHFSFRNIVWATHSDSQELLLSATTEGCTNGKMSWPDAKTLGVFLWLKSHETIKSQLEIIARNRFMMDEDRDPTSCSLIFFALGKKKVVHGLWRQAPGHKEQSLMLKFLANDFEQERWKTAAMKNAYALLSKQRYEYAAAFFMLAGNIKDAINVCVRQLDDWQLAVALAKAVEDPTSDRPLLKWILRDTVLPLAFKGGHRWLATWAFWTIGRRDLAVRILISPMNDIAGVWSPEAPIEVGNPENDDPSLLLMFQHLKSRSLQTAKGTSEISTKLEFDFVLHNARVFFRMGCHNLALDLLRSWSFERPFFPSPQPRSIKRISPPATPATVTTNTETPLSTPKPTPTRPSHNGTTTSSYIKHKRRPSFMLSNRDREGDSYRRESLLMDMDVLAETESVDPSRAPSPSPSPLPPTTSQTNGTELPDSSADGEGCDKQTTNGNSEEKRPATPPPAPKKMGNLMKELKQDVQQGAMEFNMDSFF